MKTVLPVALLIAGLVCIACSQKAPEAPSTPQPATASARKASVAPALAAAKDAWHTELLAIAREFRSYTKIAEDPSWAPTLCRPPWYTSAMISRAANDSAHGRKLYFLWVKTPDSYFVGYRRESPPDGVAQLQPAGQALVKESFQPGKGANPDDPRAPRTLGEQSDLFVMFKVDPATPRTDNGWVYGTLSADGRAVTGAGLLESCMGCHESAKHDRLFGLPASSGKAHRTD